MEDQDLPLRRRVPGAARAGPGSSVAPVLSDSVLERMQAAIDAARADPAGHDSDPDTEPIPRVAGNAPAKADKHAGGVNGVPVKPDSGARPPRTAKRRRTSTAINNVRHGRIARLQETAPTASAQPAPAGTAQPSGESPPPLPMRTVPTPAADLKPQVTAEQADSRKQAGSRKQAEAREQAEARKPQIPAERADAQPVAPPRPASQPAPAAPAHSATGQAVAHASPELTASAANARPSPNVSPAPRHLAAVHAPPSRRAQPDQRARRRRFSTARLVAAAVVVLAVAAAASALVLHGPRQTSADHKLTPLQRQAIVNQALAVSWIKQQVTPGTQISCDKQMCSALADAGYLKQDLNTLGPTSSVPASSRLVIDTAAVRSQFGSSLESAISPLALTTVGSGQARISIRLVAPHGPAALKQALAAEQRARQQNEAVLPGGPIGTSPAARADLTKGSADARLAFAIAYMAPSLPVYILEFGNVAKGASSDLPLRYADLAESDSAAHMTSEAYVAALKAAISTLPGQYRPLWVKSVRLSSGKSVLRMEVGAPS